MAETFEITHNSAQQRFEAQVEGRISVLDYQQRDQALYFTHTGVPPQLEGRGIGSQLARAGLEYARSEGLVVVPLCSFIAVYIRRHPEYSDLVQR